FVFVFVFVVTLFWFQHHFSCCQAGVQISHWRFFMYQILVTIYAGRTFCFHFLVCCLGILSRWVRFFVTGATGDAVPFFEIHPCIVCHDQSAFVKFLQRGII